jgi:hypothetical protein
MWQFEEAQSSCDGNGFGYSDGFNDSFGWYGDGLTCGYGYGSGGGSGYGYGYGSGNGDGYGWGYEMAPTQ